MRLNPLPALRRGSYANVTATLALVVALSGTGYAAASLAKNSVGTPQLKKSAVTTTKVKNGTLLSKDFKPGQLVAGAPGPVGPAGPAGAAGATGPAGPLLDTLPSGKSMKGNWGFGVTAAAAGETIQDDISFPFPLAANVTAHIIQSGDPAPAQCTGTLANPSAQAGHLCVYTRFQTGLGNLALYGSVAQGTYTHGGMVYASSTAAGLVQATGTWAVTAP